MDCPILKLRRRRKHALCFSQATVRKLRECPKHQFDEFWALSDGTTVPLQSFWEDSVLQSKVSDGVRVILLYDDF